MVDFTDYDHGFRRGTIDRCSGHPPLDLSQASRIYADGYEDGWQGNEQRIGPPVRTALEAQVIEAYAALATDSMIDVRGNSHDPHTVLETLRWAEENGFLTMPEKPSREEITAWAVENWGVNPDDVMEE